MSEELIRKMFMDIALITGSGGLIGSESVRFFSKKGFHVIGIDNDMRSVFFGKEGSTKRNIKLIKKEIENYKHYETDIRDKEAIGKIFKEYGKDIKLIIHTAAQPSHDWAAKDPEMDNTRHSLMNTNRGNLLTTFVPYIFFLQILFFSSNCFSIQVDIQDISDNKYFTAVHEEILRARESIYVAMYEMKINMYKIDFGVV